MVQIGISVVSRLYNQEHYHVIRYKRQDARLLSAIRSSPLDPSASTRNLEETSEFKLAKKSPPLATSIMAPKSLRRNLLSKQILPKPSRQAPCLLNPGSKGAEVQLQLPNPSRPSATTEPAKHRSVRELRVIEFDGSRVPQPFLDGEKVLEGLKNLRMSRKEGVDGSG
ncbi:hypothetical protein PRK78_004422 [Emydomyces testavorans]|uniref:Uncharacterized protein n=1 Tax=Emydomyces testavorans TaxID=2070801 RepID=A0AAF0DIN9_9EURO|nr:hypothetical protein PRK78_004422 [Emydomyces testavorans]